MGNHEFCTGCHENDFHYGQSCEEAYPESYHRVQEEEAARIEERRQGKILLAALKEELEQRGISVYSHSESGYDELHVTGFNLARAEKRNLQKSK